MGKINYTRVMAGGLLAGLVINLFEYVTKGVVLAPQWEEAMRALGHTMPNSATPIFILWAFLVGISAVWLYAAIRPRFAPGPKTAACAGAALWAFGYALPNLIWAALRLVPMNLLIITSIVGLIEVLAASLVGAWAYKE
jgi:hypothetical protein